MQRRRRKMRKLLKRKRASSAPAPVEYGTSDDDNDEVLLPLSKKRRVEAFGSMMADTQKAIDEATAIALTLTTTTHASAVASEQCTRSVPELDPVSTKYAKLVDFLFGRKRGPAATSAQSTLRINCKPDSFELIWAGMDLESAHSLAPDYFRSQRTGLKSASSRRAMKMTNIAALILARDRKEKEKEKKTDAETELKHKLVLKTENMVAARVCESIAGQPLIRIELHLKPVLWKEVQRMDEATDSSSVLRSVPEKSEWESVPFCWRHCVLTMQAEDAVGKLKEMESFKALLDGTAEDYKFDVDKVFASEF